MEVVLGVLLGWAIAASLYAGLRLIRPPRVVSSERSAMQEALHAATVTLLEQSPKPTNETSRNSPASPGAELLGVLKTQIRVQSTPSNFRP